MMPARADDGPRPGTEEDDMETTRTETHHRTAPPPFATDQERWSAVLDRDRRADGQFVYSVRTTGVYCRPSCAARRPRRENVRFHATGADAERAGFRPCRRCRPLEPAAADRRAAAVLRACALIEAAEEPPDLETLAAEAGLSRFHFHRLFRETTGVTPREYAAARRAERVRDALARGATVTDAIYEAGFASSAPFYAEAEALLGMRPGSFRAGGRGETIVFAVGECSLGSILVAATDKGVCAVSLGDEPEELVRQLEERFPDAELVGGDRGFDALVAKVVGFVEAPEQGLGLPLHVRGTAFQRRVWRALTELPAGATLTYGELAERIGVPDGARAVARACAANPLAVAIPCHRVVRRDGALGGYRWGVERKQRLLERESAS